MKICSLSILLLMTVALFSQSSSSISLPDDSGLDDLYVFAENPTETVDDEYAIDLSTEGFKGTDHYSIDNSVVSAAVSIPTLGEWCLICLTLLMLIIGIVAIKQKDIATTLPT